MKGAGADSIESVVLENKPCPMGCPEGDEFVLKGRDRLYNLPGEYNVVRCKGCGLMRTNPRPTPETIGFYYPDTYGPYVASKVDVTGAPDHTLLFRYVLAMICRFNFWRLPHLPKGRMLEIGCASGAFLHEMALGGWEVQGIEFSPRAAANARALGHSVHAGSVESCPDFERPFHLVVGWAVFEHLHNPILVLHRIRNWTHPDALLALSVPNMGGIGFRIFKDASYSLHLPNHLYHFSVKTLRSVLERGGWRLTRVFHQRHLHDMIASVGYLLRDKGYWNRLTKTLVDFLAGASLPQDILLYPLASLLALCGESGRMTVWAEKL